MESMVDKFERMVREWKRALLGEGMDGGEGLGKLREEGFVGRRLAEYGTWDEGAAFRRFAARVGGRRRRLRGWMWSGVAAGAACVVGLALLLREGDVAGREETVAVARVENEVIAPGSAKARLKLASGEVVQVAGDSMRIAGEGGSRITYGGGQLSYRAEGRTAELVYNELEVPVGGECDILLADGTRVWVNADSRLRYPEQFVGEERRVFLEGEAYFEVAKDGKPFIVRTDRGDVRVLGTVFNVKAYGEEREMQTTLVEGRVRVSDAGREVELAPGEQAVVTSAGLEKRTVDVEEYVGWQKGVYVFRRQTLGNIMRDLERWYGVSVFFQQASLKEVVFTGNLKRYDHINAFMEVLERTGDVKYNINKNTVIIYK